MNKLAKKKNENGKWWTYGRVFENDFGYLTLVLYKDEIQKLMNTDHRKIYLSLFEDDKKYEKKNDGESHEKEETTDDFSVDDDTAF